MNEITTFSNEQFGAVRTMSINGEPWFVGKDVAEILGYSNPRKALADHIEQEDKGVTKCDTLGGAQDLTIINESGLYSLILSSKMQKAKEFKRWVTSEVLPTIRKTGAYMTDATLEKAIAEPEYIIGLLQALVDERNKKKELESQNAIQAQQIAEYEPKANYYDLVLQSKDLTPITVIAKDYGLSGKKMNEILHQIGIQYNMNGIWLLYQKYANCGYTKTRTFVVNDDDKIAVHTYWTQSGRLFIYDEMKRNGYLPEIEKC